MLLKKCFLPALPDEIKRRCYVGHNRYRFTFMTGHHLHWSPLTIDDQRGNSLRTPTMVSSYTVPISINICRSKPAFCLRENLSIHEPLELNIKSMIPPQTRRSPINRERGSSLLLF